MVTPWEVEGDQEIDYDKLVKTFGSMRITEVGTQVLFFWVAPNMYSCVV